MMWKFWKRCIHDYEFVRNIYGDEINQHNSCRSEWKCKKCGKIEYRPFLQRNSICEKLDNLYDEYYKNKYEEWLTLRGEMLNNMLQEMMKLSKEGQCAAEFTLWCEEDKNDRNYFDKWFRENQLKVEFGLNSQDFKISSSDDDNVKSYTFKVRWKYKMD